MQGSIRIGQATPGIALIEIDSPPVNAISRSMLTAFSKVLEEVERDPSVRAIVIAGTGRAFCSGADLKEAARAGAGELAFGILLDQLAQCALPTIAAIHGPCAGGGLELALCCDVRVADESARFICSGVNVGYIASACRLPRLIGLSRAKTMLLTGLPYDAATALQWGLVTELTEPGEAPAAAIRLAGRIASRAPLAIAAAMRCADRALELSVEEGTAMVDREATALRGTADYAEGIRAFAERREAVFLGG